MNRIMCIDYGDARIGIAMTDPLKIIVSAHSTLNNDDKSIDSIKEIFISKSVYEVVIGLPYGKDSEIGDAAKKVINFTQKLKNCFDINGLEYKLFYQDERYSTRDAAETMREIGVKTKRKKSLVDQIAACYILKSFLDSKYKEEVVFTNEVL
ncbi:MAG: hypothetical protein A2015_01680 [Spirochaetes bacterium GWF1_31_7]|nr:MAG: hypothetical protein A2Y30_03045 [Spirochaetes bacterium GWE1_32_154]OHD48310.1 MAG: hypothetical protein A2Y29_05560 [Spirochaetes bacterium GWE2_31_10]OHD49298.1 MAG: hypothetical protein A2015_01680 [Spirochaetes bacterium GWF1_31_7]OHD81137.1 MAG: hypothetical protein A2355_16540 [Spirochaetes bacterium RIFOXYB1_FULL_32_8]HBD92962.1 Holliday junction resolvase RuvX [Spirochaetia bacterium]